MIWSEKNLLINQRKMWKLVKKNWPIPVILGISAIIYRVWLWVGIFSSNDWYFNFRETLLDYSNPSVWLTNSYLGSVDWVASKLPIYLAQVFFARMGFDSNISEKFLYFWPFAFITGLAIFFLARKIFKNNSAALVSSFVYSFNTYFLAINTQGHFSLTVAASFVPLVILFYIKAQEELNISWAIIASFLLFVVGSYDFRSLYITAAIISFYYFFDTFFLENIKIGKKTLLFFAFGLITLLLNVFWMMAYYSMGSLSQNEVLSRDLIDFSLNLPRAITLFHPFWNGGSPIWFRAQGIPIYFWLIPIFALTGLWLNRKNKKIAFFGLVGLAGIFLSKQDASPFGGAYYFFHDTLPGFSAFREASKFYLVIVIGYSILIGSFIDWLWNNWSGQKIKIAGKYLFFFIISILFLWNTKPIVTGEMGTLFATKSIPREDLRLRKFVNDQPNFFRVLYFPVRSRWISNVNNHPAVDALEIERSLWGNINKELEQGVESEIPASLVGVLDQPFSGNLLSQSGIKYVVVGQDATKDYDFFVESLEHVPYLKKVDIDGGITVFENIYLHPKIYRTEKPETIHTTNPFSNVQFQMISASQYQLQIKNITGPFYLNFSEAYHPDWKIRAGDFKWVDAIGERSYFLSNESHFETDAGLNSYRLDPAKICSASSSKCIKNQDGSFSLELTIFFQPQGYYYLGIIIGIVTFLFCLIVLAYEAKKRHNKV